MMGLFSPFNPITNNNLSMNWMMLLLPIMFTAPKMWTMMSKSATMKNLFTKNMMYQFKSSMTKISSPNLMMIILVLMMILMYNMLSLMPNTFSITSHMMINMSMALTLWMSLMKKKMNNPIKMMSNLTPMNTPKLLIPFMVMIELISTMIQPITLSIRLTANITAGHIMMILISQMYTIQPLPSLIMNMMMMMLELGVSFIQAYVFSMLMIMYNK